MTQQKLGRKRQQEIMSVMIKDCSLLLHWVEGGKHQTGVAARINRANPFFRRCWLVRLTQRLENVSVWVVPGWVRVASKWLNYGGREKEGEWERESRLKCRLNVRWEMCYWILEEATKNSSLRSTTNMKQWRRELEENFGLPFFTRIGAHRVEMSWMVIRPLVRGRNVRAEDCIVLWMQEVTLHMLAESDMKSMGIVYLAVCLRFGRLAHRTGLLRRRVWVLLKPFHWIEQDSPISATIERWCTGKMRLALAKKKKNCYC